MNKLFFEIPDNQEIMTKLVEGMPLWSWVDGGLYAPKDLIDSGTALLNTGFILQRFKNAPTIVGGYDNNDKGGRVEADLFGIMIERKLPTFISLNEAGFDADIVRLELVRRIVAGFIRKGYRGGLHCYKDYDYNDKFDNGARCSMAFRPWQGMAIEEESGKQPARVRLEWLDNREKDIEPIVILCRSLNLQEYKPASITSLV